MIISPRISLRKTNESLYNIYLENGYLPIQAKILANRVKNEKQALEIANPKLIHLTQPSKLSGIEKAVQRLITAMENNEIIGIETDHDCDGQTSHAVLIKSIVDGFGYSRDKVRSYIGHRMQEGYGLSLSLAKRIINDEPKPTLIITADNGSSDEERISLLRSHGIDTIVTDHHAIPTAGIPKSAYAVINPSQDCCEYADTSIAGCMVSWLFMAQVKTELHKLGWKKLPDMRDTMDLVAVGTVADCVSMSDSVNNRAITKFGLNRIDNGNRLCWQALKESHPRQINSEYIGFTIGPLLNSDGRLSDAFSSVSFLLSDNEPETHQWVKYLTEQNEQRKVIQKTITDDAILQARTLMTEDKNSLCIYLDKGHAGVHGISASRIKDKFGRPTIIFSPKENEKDVVSGSARSVDGVNIKQALDEINHKKPDLMLKYGGHLGAAGLSIKLDDFQIFSDLFEGEITNIIQPHQIGPVIYTDGELNSDDVSLKTIVSINELEPFGRGFEYPIFEISALILSIKLVGQLKNHAQILLQLNNGLKVKGIWFNCEGSIKQIKPNQHSNIIGALTKSEYKGNTYLNINIQYIAPHE